uniref:Uncharacterized protein n=1 Tax=Anopheles christyi TaxID=43041 RepID=A0A182K399_9DIPT
MGFMRILMLLSEATESIRGPITNPAVDTNPKGGQKIVRPHRPPPPPPLSASTKTTQPSSPSVLHQPATGLDQPPVAKAPPPPKATTTTTTQLRVKEGEPAITTTTVTHRKSVSFDLHEDTHSFETALHHARAAFAGPSPSPDLKGILRASSPSSSSTNRSTSSTPEAVQQIRATETPKVVMVANIDTDPDTDSDTDSDTDASEHDLLVVEQSKGSGAVGPVPSAGAGHMIRRAEVVRNQAAQKLHEEFGQGDLVEYEHDMITNTIREVVPCSARPERVEMLSAKYETRPVKRTAQFVHENTPNNLLVPDELHRKVLLEENEVRNKLLAQYAQEQHHHHQQQVYTMHHHSPGELIVGRVSSPYLYDSGSASVSPAPSHFVPGSVYDHNNYFAKLGGPLSPSPPPPPVTATPSDIGYHLPQIYPPVQILPVHYTKLPTPQHTIYTYASGTVPTVSHAPIVSLATRSQPLLPYTTPYHLPYRTVGAGTSTGMTTFVSSAHPSSSTAHVLMPVSDPSIRLVAPPRSAAPEHTSLSVLTTAAAAASASHRA